VAAVPRPLVASGVRCERDEQWEGRGNAAIQQHMRRNKQFMRIESIGMSGGF
jgi:hypothetical protein